MNKYQLNNFNVQLFLKEYWQQKPGVFKQAFTLFEDPLDEHELAGLAQEEEIDSRIISCQQDTWQVDFGPFDSFAQLCQGQWSLLVKGVNFHIPAVEQLFDAFNFLPIWRKDDVMVSFSNQNGGVGPHLDEYDVFIIQGKGRRRWQIGPIGEYNICHPHPELTQISEFSPIIDQVLTPGDMIYIPPKFPHNGIALEDCLNYSIGFRAPNQQELLLSFADYALERGFFNKRYRDPKLTPNSNAHQIDRNAINHIRALMEETLQTAVLEDWFGEFASGHHSVHIPEEEAETIESCSEKILTKQLSNGARLIREPWSQAVYFEQTLDSTDHFRFYICGTAYQLPMSLKQEAIAFLSAKAWPSSKPSFNITEPKYKALIALISDLVNLGYWSIQSS